MNKTIHNLQELETFAQTLLADQVIQTQATVVLLSGDLGTGKTAFVKACAKNLGIHADITSPTFVIQKEYALQDQKWQKMIHIDAYRLQRKEDLELLGWNTIITDPQNIIFLEWPEMVQGITLPLDTQKLRLSILQEEIRKIEKLK